MLDHQPGTFVMADAWAPGGVIERIRKVTHEDTSDAPAAHLPDPERSLEHTEIRMHSHDEQRLNIARAQQAVDFEPVIRNSSRLLDGDGRMLPRPGAKAGALRAIITPPVRIVDRERRLVDMPAS